MRKKVLYMFVIILVIILISIITCFTRTRNNIPKEILDFISTKESPVLLSQIAFSPGDTTLGEDYIISMIKYKRKKIYFREVGYKNTYDLVDLYKQISLSDHMNVIIFFNQEEMPDNYISFINNLLTHFGFSKKGHNNYIFYFKEPNKSNDNFDDILVLSRFFEKIWIDDEIIDSKKLIDYYLKILTYEEVVILEQGLYKMGAELIGKHHKIEDGINIIKVTRLFNITKHSPEISSKLNDNALVLIEKFDFENAKRLLDLAYELDPSSEDVKKTYVKYNELKRFLEEEIKKYPK